MAQEQCYTEERGARRKALAAVLIGKWFRVKITCSLGKESTPTYDLTLTLPAQRSKVFPRLPNRSAQFTRLHWLGFLSFANAKAIFYIDNIRLMPTR